MANTITKQTILDGSRLLVVKVHILGDGTGEETDTLLIDASSYSPAFTDASVRRITAALSGFAATLEWDATADTPLCTLPEGESILPFEFLGNVPSDAGAGVTGDINFTTNGLGANDQGTIIIELVKK